MKLNHLANLQAVEAVLRLGTFRAAADELGITPAALGQRVRALEQFLDQSLFERLPDRARPTPAAEAAAKELSAGFARLSTAYQALSQQQPSNRLSVSMTKAMAEHWLPQYLPRLYDLIEDADVRIESTVELIDMHSGAYDFAVRYTGEPSAGLAGIPLFRGCLVPLCTPEFAERHDLKPNRRDLDSVPLVHLEDVTTDPTWVDWEGWCRTKGVAMPTSTRTQTFSHQTSGLRIAESGFGLVLGMLFDAGPALENGRLVMPFGAESIHQVDYCYWLIWSRRRRLSPLQSIFRTWLVDLAEDQCRRLSLPQLCP